MRTVIQRLVSACVGALLAMAVVLPLAAGAAAANPSTGTASHLAKAMAAAPKGVTHWTIIERDMTLSRLPSHTGKLGVSIRDNIVYGNCGSSWMAIGALGGGQVWVALGWDIYYSAYWETWATAVYAPNGAHYNGGGGGIAPWSSTSWDTGYRLTTGVGWVLGYAYMTAYLYNGGACSSNLPSGWAFAY